MSQNTIAIVGDGASTRKNTAALLKDWSTPNSLDRIIFPGTESLLTDAVRHVADWGLSNISGEVLTAIVAEGETPADLSDYTDEGVIVLPVPDVVEHLVSQATHLFLAWGEDDQFYSDLAEAALKRGVKVYDLTDGLFPIALDEGTASDAASEPVSEPETAPEPEPTPEPEKPAQRARSSRAKATDKPAESAPDEGQQFTASAASSHSKPVDSTDALRELVAQRAAEIVLERLAAALGK